MSQKPRPHGSFFPQDILTAIGNLTVTYSAMDLQIKILIWKLINPQIASIGKVVTASMPMKGLLSLLSSLFMERTKDQTLIAQMKSVVQVIDQLSHDRNDFIHGIWVARPTEDSALRGQITASRRKGLVQETTVITAEQVDALTHRVAEARLMVVDLDYAITNASPALQTG